MSQIELIERTTAALMAAEVEGFEHTANAFRAELVLLATTNPQREIGVHNLRDEAENVIFRSC